MGVDHLHNPCFRKGLQRHKDSHVGRLSNWHTYHAPRGRASRCVNTLRLGLPSQAIQRSREAVTREEN